MTAKERVGENQIIILSVSNFRGKKNESTRGFIYKTKYRYRICLYL